MAENKSEDDSFNKSSSFLFDSLYDSALLAALDPPQDSDPSDEEGSEAGKVRGPLPSTQERRRSELLANQEAERQEAVQWGESSFNRSEWGDSLLVGEHFLERQSLLKHAERSQREPEERHPEERRSGPMRQQHTTSAATATQRDSDCQLNTDSRDEAVKPAGRREDGEEMRAVPSDKTLSEHVHVENALFDCSPGVQEIFDRWPSMSDQPCQDAAFSHNPETAESPGLSSVEGGAERGQVPTAVPEGDPPEAKPSRQDCEDVAERPESAGDLIPPTQGAPPVTPRIKLTTSSVQSPHAAPPLSQSTPSTSRPAQRTVAARGPKPQARRSDTVGTLRKPDAAKNLGHRNQEEQKKLTPPSQPGSIHAPPRQNLRGPSALTVDPLCDGDPSVIEAGFSLQLSQEASLCSSNSGLFSIIDVASDRRLFETFIQEWKTKERYSLALACQKTENRHLAAGKSQNLAAGKSQILVPGFFFLQLEFSLFSLKSKQHKKHFCFLRKWKKSKAGLAI